jgi:ketosteroid isomerase-like protein
MSQENAEIVRQPVAVAARSRRRLEERLGLRFPRVRALLVRAVQRLPPRSGLRRALLRRAVVSGWQALNRGDLEVSFALYHPNVVSEVAPGLVSIGLGDTRGRDARVALQKEGLAGFGEFRFESEELIDLGDGRLLTVGRMKGSGLSSGAAFDQDWAALLTISMGWVIHEQIFLNRREALEAVGLRE